MFCISFNLSSDIEITWINKTNLPRGRYEGITASAHDFTNLKASSWFGVSKSSKNIPPTPLLSPMGTKTKT